MVHRERERERKSWNFIAMNFNVYLFYKSNFLKFMCNIESNFCGIN